MIQFSMHNLNQGLPHYKENHENNETIKGWISYYTKKQLRTTRGKKYHIYQSKRPVIIEPQGRKVTSNNLSQWTKPPPLLPLPPYLPTLQAVFSLNVLVYVKGFCSEPSIKRKKKFNLVFIFLDEE